MFNPRVTGTTHNETKLNDEAKNKGCVPMRFMSAFEKEIYG